ncbi:Aste57867_12241 [Aphanomyces stellatus]|uniref:Aste57867_12241 protein n=1 Tax=Aphanomyces stellatus TaxID=120398 RepID=A0A485KV16_9STRA|nr:hypothetical protein As57867_012196 [Aphanomyces stellatus]VFT89095.1 Aste57867_12241 [Aphanomyces stellatus]
MNPNQHHRGVGGSSGVTFQQVFQWLSREGWFSQWGVSGMSYFKPGTLVGNAVFNQNVFVGEANVEMYWRHSGDWQRVERMLYQAQLNNQMQNQMNQHHRNQHHMTMSLAAQQQMPRPMAGPPTALPSSADLLDQRSRSLNYPLDMLCDILAVDRDATPQQQQHQQQQQQQQLLQQQGGRPMQRRADLPMHHPQHLHQMPEPTRFAMLDPTTGMPHPSVVMFQNAPGAMQQMMQVMQQPPQGLHGLPPPPPPPLTSVPPMTSSVLDVMSSLPSAPPPPTTAAADDMVASSPDAGNSSGADASTATDVDPTSLPCGTTDDEPKRPKKRRSRNLYIRLDQMKTVLRKHGWKWAEGPLGFIYCKPHVEVANRGKTISGKEGVDYFSGRAPFEAYVRGQRSLMELIQNDLKEKHGGAVFSMEIPPEDQLCAPTYKERAEMARRKQMKAKRLAALAARKSKEAEAAAAAAPPSTAEPPAVSPAATEEADVVVAPTPVPIDDVAVPPPVDGIALVEAEAPSVLAKEAVIVESTTV